MALAPLIVIEGIDGTGKSSVLPLIAEKLGILSTRMPGGTPFAEKHRAACLTEDIDSVTQMLFYSALNADNMRKHLELRECGAAVISDRGFGSTFAYQALNAGQERLLYGILEALPKAYTPDLTLYLNIDADVAYAREHGQGRSEDRYGSADRVYKEKIKEAYDLLYNVKPATSHIPLSMETETLVWHMRPILSKKVAVIDANKTLDEVVEQCISAIRSNLPIFQ